MSTLEFIVQQTMFFAIPLLIVSLGALYSERSGVSNIAMEGIMILGAFAGTVTIRLCGTALPGQTVLLLSMLVAALAGMVYSLLHAWSAIALRADQTISGTALNMFAPAFCVFTARILFGIRQVDFTDRFFIDKVPLLGDIPVLGPFFFTNCYLSTYIGILLLFIMSCLLRRTRFGLHLSACGENPDAAAAAGISVRRMRYIGVLISGLFGGMGGLIFVVPTTTTYSGSVAGYGFLALAVLILGRWEPLRILGASFLFGVMKAFSSAYSGIPFLAGLSIPAEVYKAAPYVITLIVLVLSARQSAAPKAVGVPYDDGIPVFGERGRKKAVTLAALAIAFVAATACITTANVRRFRSLGVSDGFGAEIALIVSSGSTVDDKSFVQGEWEGLVEYSRENGKTVKYYQAKDHSDETLRRLIDLADRGNAKTVVMSAAEMSAALYTAQDEHPDIRFILCDETPKNANGEERIAPNTVCLSFEEAQGGFLAGYAAVKDGYRDLGFIGGVPVPALVRFGYGYAAGIDYAMRELGLDTDDVHLRYHYAGTFSATPEVLSLASSWYHHGVEVIFACGGEMGNSVMKAAENAGAAVIGVDKDQSGESPSVITSAVKDMRTTLKNVLAQGPDAAGGTVLRMGVKDGSLFLPMATSRFRVFSEEDYQAILQKLAEGEIELPDDKSAETADRLPLTRLKVEVL